MPSPSFLFGFLAQGCVRGRGDIVEPPAGPQGWVVGGGVSVYRERQQLPTQGLHTRPLSTARYRTSAWEGWGVYMESPNLVAGVYF